MSSCGASHRELIRCGISSIQVNNNEQNIWSKSSQHNGRTYIPLSSFNQNHNSLYTSERHHKVTPESLRCKLYIWLNRAQATIKCTIQLGLKSKLHLLTCIYRTYLLQLKYQRLKCTIYTDTIFSATKALNQSTCCQIWTDGKGYIFADPMRSKNETNIWHWIF